MEKMKWYNYGNIVSIIATYMEPKNILSIMHLSKSLFNNLNTNKIWWELYNRAFTTVRVLDQYIWQDPASMAEGTHSCTAREAFRGMTKAKKEGFNVSPDNKYRIFLRGRFTNPDSRSV